jgi:hypothetical protein
MCRTKRERNRMLRFTFRLSHVKKIAFHVSFERNVKKIFIFMKIALERKNFRLRSTFRCSNVIKIVVFHVSSEQNVTSKR